MKAKRKTIKHPHDNIASITHVPYKEGKNKFEIYIRKKYSPTGKPQRLYKATQNIAKDYVNELTDELGEYGLSSLKQINPDQRADAARALKILPATGFKELEPAIKHLLELKEKEDAKSDITVAQIVDEKIAKVRGRVGMRAKGKNVKGGSNKTLIEYEYYGKILKKEHGYMRAVDFKNKEHFFPIYEELGYRENFRKVCHAIFNLCIKEHAGKVIKRGQNPITQDKEDIADKDPAYLKQDQWKKLVLTAIATENEDYKKGNAYELTGWATLGLWCGLRPDAELRLLDWKDIDLDYKKRVWVYSSKTRKKRHVDIPNCAVEILKKVAKKKGLVVKQKNYHKRVLSLKARAGVGRPIWVNDIMRHTFASMHWAMHQDERELIKQMGHIDNSELDYYVAEEKDLVDHAEEFWNFTPPISQCTGSGNPDLRTS